MKGSFPQVLLSGGELDAQSAYEEAHNAVFQLQLTWRHTQPHKSRRDGKTRWSMIEMWPMHVSLALSTDSGSVALLLYV